MQYRSLAKDLRRAAQRLLWSGVLVVVTSLAWAAEPLDWSDLVDPAVQGFDDPYRDLNPLQLDALRGIVEMRILRDAGKAPEDAQVQIDAALQAFSEQGLDPEWLIAQRWRVAEEREAAATSGNPALEGREVTLRGYVIPTPQSDDREIYLVPQSGMCSHIPPPDPNQMIRAEVSADWTQMGLYEPVQVTGRLSVAPSEREMVVLDGPVAMRATFRMQVKEVMSLAPAGGLTPPTPHGNRWSQDILQRLQSAGALPSEPLLTRD